MTIRISKYVIVSCMAVWLCGCLPEVDSPYSVSEFSAKYYVEYDGRNPGTGTDGTDPSIVPELVHEETVTRPAIHYLYDYQFDIDSYNFYGEWVGEINAHQEAYLNANFSVSRSDVSFYVDDVLVEKWGNSSKVIPLHLDAGKHSVRVEYHNHWHTANFNVSFTDYETTTISDDISDRIDELTKITHIAAYESSHSNSLYNEVEITLSDSSSPQLLFLWSYRAINWIIRNPNNVELKGVVVSGTNPGSVVSNAGEGFVLEATDFSSGYDDFTQARASIYSMVGRFPDYEYGQYSLSDTSIPAM